MKKRLILLFTTTVLVIVLNGCCSSQMDSYDTIAKSPIETVTTVSITKVTTVTEIPLVTSITEVEQSEVEFSELITSVTEPEPTIPTRFQSGIEIYTENSNFEISDALVKKLYSTMKSYPNTAISWGLYSLNNDDFISMSKDTEFSSCSTIKVVYSLYCLEQVKQGEASLDDILYYDKKKHHYNSSTASKSTIATLGRTEFTLREIISYTLNVSDNDAYMLLLDYYGFDGFNDYMESLGSSTNLSSDMLYGHATVLNRATEWKRIYSFFNESDEVSEFFKTTLLNAKYGYIEEGLGYETAHKSGWSNHYGAAHDCAIVYSPNGEYLMIILTQKANSSPQKYLVKQLSKILDEIWCEYSTN